jgi:hypothetical protein
MPPAKPEKASASHGRFSSERAFSVADSKISWAVKRRLSGLDCSFSDIRHLILLNALGFSLRKRCLGEKLQLHCGCPCYSREAENR